MRTMFNRHLLPIIALAAASLGSVNDAAADVPYYLGLPYANQNSKVHYQRPATTSDYDGDGTSDLMFRDQVGDMALWQMLQGNFANGFGLGTVGTDFSIVGRGDFNADGTTDLLWLSNGCLSIWNMKNDAVLSAEALACGLGDTWSVVGIGDFDGDQSSDILLRDTSGDLVAWFIANNAIRGSAGLGNVGMGWKIVGIADINGDGESDLLWRDGNSDLVVWLLNYNLQICPFACGPIHSYAIATVTSDWAVVGLGDFYRTGTSQILFRNTNDGTVVLWRLAFPFGMVAPGSTVGAGISSATLGTVPLDWILVGVGDFNGDAASDLLWRHTPEGTIVTWEMNGGTIASSTTVATVDLSWSIVSPGSGSSPTP
jgi:hypothetical protein